ncbi:MAG TPA: rod shape-determining protein RodA [Acidimicrobiales bacterium]|jgi:rod shape determining protein RodA|nr:rod shape-determining protein RodA [Acidimicrobiales bacterium]
MATYDQSLSRFGAHGRSRSGLGAMTAAPVRHLDLVLLGVVGIIQSLGLLMVFSATRGPNPPFRYGYLTKQAVFVVLGVAALSVVSLIDYRRFRDYALFVYGAGVFLLFLVLVPGVGSSAKGHQSWISLGPFQLQPSELNKITLIVGLAGVLTHYQGDIDLRRLGIVLGMAAVPMALVLVQGDLGTTLVFAVVVPTMLAIGGARPKHLAVLLLAGILVATVALSGGVLKQYQRDRLTTFLHQDTAAATGGAAYNLNRAKIAIGRGGMFGQGLFRGSQTRLSIVPEQHTDFIFTAVGEQFGFFGAGLLLVLFCLMVWRIWRTALLARDEFGTLICVGVLAMLVFHTFENVGMTMGIMPITGIPLPFMSYGGSSTLLNFLAIGFVLNVHMRRFS